MITPMSDVLRIEARDSRLEITLNRPQKRNAINRELNSALAAAFREFDSNADARVAVLTGADPAFCAGMDLSDLAWADREHTDRTDTFARALRDVHKPVIAAVNGAAITGGLELALGCDFIIASERAVFGDTHARVGVFPGGGMTVHLADAIGIRRARQMSFTGELVDAQEAVRIGLANEIVAHGDLLTRARALADAVAGIDAPLLAKLRAAYRRRANLGLDDALNAESDESWRYRPTASDIAARRADVIRRGRDQIRR